MSAVPDGPLSGLRIVDLSSVILGPYASQLLADYGADVVKVEPLEGDITRNMGPAGEQGMSALFLGVNCSKRSIALDIKSAVGRAALARIVATADVLMHNIRPQKLATLGLDEETLFAVNPRLVYATLYGFGEDGPYSGRPAYDDIIQGMTGYAGFMQKLYGRAGYLPTAIADKVTALFAVQAILAGVVQRDRTGAGVRTVVPMFETLVSFALAEQMYGHHFDPPKADIGYPRMVMPERHPYPTADGLICIMPYNDRNWRDFFDIAGRPEVFLDPRFNTVGARTQNIAALYTAMGEELLKKPTEEWLRLLKEKDIPAGPMRMPENLQEDEHLRAVGHFHRIEDPSMGALVFASNPVSFGGRKQAPRLPPRLGQDTRRVLRDCGFSDAEIESLLASGTARAAQADVVTAS